jgi:glycosyltransferase involved in cell wall biosynthesis
MASGLPCLATRSSGTHDLVVDGVTGFLYSPNNGFELADSLARLSKHKMLEMGRNGRRKAEKAYSLDKIAKEYSTLYKTLRPIDSLSQNTSTPSDASSMH